MKLISLLLLVMISQPAVALTATETSTQCLEEIQKYQTDKKITDPNFQTISGMPGFTIKLPGNLFFVTNHRLVECDVPSRVDKIFTFALPNDTIKTARWSRGKLAVQEGKQATSTTCRTETRASAVDNFLREQFKKYRAVYSGGACQSLRARYQQEDEASISSACKEHVFQCSEKEKAIQIEYSQIAPTGAAPNGNIGQ